MADSTIEQLKAERTAATREDVLATGPSAEYMRGKNTSPPRLHPHPATLTCQFYSACPDPNQPAHPPIRRHSRRRHNTASARRGERLPSYPRRHHEQEADGRHSYHGHGSSC